MLRPMAGSTSRHDVTVRFAETDAQGVAHHASYFVWFEVTRIEYLRRFRGGYSGLRAEGVDALTLEVYANYVDAARFDDRLHDQRPLRRRPRCAVPLRLPGRARGRASSPRAGRRTRASPSATTGPRVSLAGWPRRSRRPRAHDPGRQRRAEAPRGAPRRAGRCRVPTSRWRSTRAPPRRRRSSSRARTSTRRCSRTSPRPRRRSTSTSSASARAPWATGSRRRSLAKAREGVPVRLVVDRQGSDPERGTKRALRELSAAGAEVCVVRATKPRSRGRPARRRRRRCTGTSRASGTSTIARSSSSTAGSAGSAAPGSRITSRTGASTTCSSASTGPVVSQLQLVFVASLRWLGGEIRPASRRAVPGRSSAGDDSRGRAAQRAGALPADHRRDREPARRRPARRSTSSTPTSPTAG